MGIFSFLKKWKKDNPSSSSVILGMILLKEPNTFDLHGTVNELKSKWNLDIDDKDADNETAILKIGKYKVVIGNMPVAIPENEVEKTAEFNYFWENGVEETSKHKGHIVLSIMNAGKDAVHENILYCKLASAVMNNSKSIGIYIGSRTLVLEKEFYQTNVEMMTEEHLPLYNWIYFGLRSANGKQSIYTFGLADFGKKEMEIVDSTNSLEDLNEMMFSLSHYVVANNVKLKDGETIGFSAEQKLKITESNGRFLEGKILKIDY